jgi:hypothetical protein
MAYKQQAMDFKWQIARKIDRLDIGTFAALEFFYRTAIIYGLVRAMDPQEDGEIPDPVPAGYRSVDQLITSIDERIKDLLAFDTTAIQLGKIQLNEVKDFQVKTMSAYYELGEVAYRCKLTDNVRVQEAEAP